MTPLITCFRCCPPDSPTRLILTLDWILNDVLVEKSDHVIKVVGQPGSVAAVKENGVDLYGTGEYIDAGADVLCSSSTKRCNKGYTVRFKVKPHSLLDRTTFVSSPELDVYYDDGRLQVNATSDTQLWHAETTDVVKGDWNQIDVTWRPDRGLFVYVNEKLRDSALTSAPYTGSNDTQSSFLIGAKNDSDTRSADAVFDDFQIWQRFRPLLVTDGYIKEGNVYAVFIHGFGRVLFVYLSALYGSGVSSFLSLTTCLTFY